MQREASIRDQQRKCRQRAEQDGLHIPPELEFFDEAVSGTKRDRDGLNRMLEAAEQGRFSTLYIESLSRLARESILTMPILKRLVYRYGIRIVVLDEGIDTANEGWDLIASILAQHHERYVKDLGKQVFRGQEGAILDDYGVGDYCLGFTSEPIPGSEQGRRGRNAKPRTRYAIDPETSQWVRRIFHWFVIERREIAWIVRELNRLNAPKDHRSTTPTWRHPLVLGVLKNRKYIGVWPWGESENVRDPETGDVRQEPRDEEEARRWTRHFPELRLIEDDVFEQAQQLLQENSDRYAGNRKANGQLNGSKPGSGDARPRNLLSGLLRCEKCGSTFHVGGANGRYYFCPKYKPGVCEHQTQVRRDLAESMILDAIGLSVLDNPAWREEVFRQTLAAWREQRSSTPEELRTIDEALNRVERKIQRLLDSIEEDEAGPDIQERLAQRRRERDDLRRQRQRLQRSTPSDDAKPTREWVDAQLKELGESLHGGGPAAAHALRTLVGESIIVREIRTPGKQRFHVELHMKIRRASLTPECNSNDGAGAYDEIVIDLREPSRESLLAEEAKALFDEGFLVKDIAELLGVHRNMANRALRYWYESRGEDVPNLRARRMTIDWGGSPRKYIEICPQVRRLYEAGEPLQEIAKQLGCTRDVIDKSLKYLAETEGLVLIDGRTRRKNLNRKAG